MKENLGPLDVPGGTLETPLGQSRAEMGPRFLPKVFYSNVLGLLFFEGTIGTSPASIPLLFPGPIAP